MQAASGHTEQSYAAGQIVFRQQGVMAWHEDIQKSFHRRQARDEAQGWCAEATTSDLILSNH